MKVLLLDVDGVVLTKGEYFSERFAREHHVDVTSVTEFFKGPFVECQKGAADLKDVLEPYLKKWKWKGDVESFLQYWFTSDFHIDEENVTRIKHMRALGVKCYLASNNEKYRAEYIESKLRSLGLIDGAYFSWSIRSRKDNPLFFRHVLDALHVDAKDVGFVDNDEKNVRTAGELGIQARLYNTHIWSEFDGSETKRELKQKIS